MMPLRHPFIIELLDDIDRHKVMPLTTIKNIESVLAEFVHEYPDYETMLKELQEFNYVKLV